MKTPEHPERKRTGWRLPTELRDRISALAKRRGLFAEDVATDWLEDRLLQEEKRDAEGLGRPIKKR